MGNSESAFANQAFKAVRAGNEKKLQQLLGAKKNRNINVQDVEGATLLSVAVQNYNPGICSLLINSGANINAADTFGFTALHKAVLYNFDEKLILMLIKNGAEIDYNLGENKRTPLIEATIAGNEKVVEILLNNGADANLADKEGMTPLHWAAQTGNEVLVQCLLDHKADVNVRDKSNATPLLKAKAEDHVNIVKMLEKHFCKLYKIDYESEVEEDAAGTAGGSGVARGNADPAATAAAIIMGWNVAGGGGANERNSSSSNVSTNSRQADSGEEGGKKKKKKKPSKDKANKKGGSARKEKEEKKKKKKKKKGAKTAADGEEREEGEASNTAVMTVPGKQQKKTKEEELLALDETKFCKICFERPMDTVLLGCGHVAICMFCSQYLQTCPLCSSPIEKVSKIYFS